MFDHNIIPLVHELTALITANKDNTNNMNQASSTYSYSLKIGLNEYVQNYLGMGAASCNHGLDIQNYLIEQEKIYENDPQILSYIKTKGLFWRGITYRSFGTSSLDSSNFGVECCSSFVAYLVQSYGIENVVKMVEGYDDSIYYLYNQNGIEGLISDWQQFLSKYPCKMTMDEMNAAINAFRSTHGY